MFKKTRFYSLQKADSNKFDIEQHSSSSSPNIDDLFGFDLNYDEIYNEDFGELFNSIKTQSNSNLPSGLANDITKFIEFATKDSLQSVKKQLKLYDDMIDEFKARYLSQIGMYIQRQKIAIKKVDISGINSNNTITGPSELPIAASMGIRAVIRILLLLIKDAKEGMVGEVLHILSDVLTDFPALALLEQPSLMKALKPLIYFVSSLLDNKSPAINNKKVSNKEKSLAVNVLLQMALAYGSLSDMLHIVVILLKGISLNTLKPSNILKALINLADQKSIKQQEISLNDNNDVTNTISTTSPINVDTNNVVTVINDSDGINIGTGTAINYDMNTNIEIQEYKRLNEVKNNTTNFQFRTTDQLLNTSFPKTAKEILDYFSIDLNKDELSVDTTCLIIMAQLTRLCAKYQPESKNNGNESIMFELIAPLALGFNTKGLANMKALLDILVPQYLNPPNLENDGTKLRSYLIKMSLLLSTLQLLKAHAYQFSCSSLDFTVLKESHADNISDKILDSIRSHVWNILKDPNTGDNSNLECHKLIFNTANTLLNNAVHFFYPSTKQKMTTCSELLNLLYVQDNTLTNMNTTILKLLIKELTQIHIIGQKVSSLNNNNTNNIEDIEIIKAILKALCFVLKRHTIFTIDNLFANIDNNIDIYDEIILNVTYALIILKKHIFLNIKTNNDASIMFFLLIYYILLVYQYYIMLYLN